MICIFIFLFRGATAASLGGWRQCGQLSGTENQLLLPPPQPAPFKREGLKGRNLFDTLINNYKKRDVINHVPNLGFILSAATRYEPLGKPGRKSKLSAGAFS